MVEWYVYRIADMRRDHFNAIMNNVNNDADSFFVMRYSIRKMIMMVLICGSYIRSVAEKLQNGKAVGKDGVPAEVFRYDAVQLLHVISICFTECLKFNNLPKLVMDTVVRPIIKLKTKFATDKGNCCIKAISYSEQAWRPFKNSTQSIWVQVLAWERNCDHYVRVNN